MMNTIGSVTRKASILSSLQGNALVSLTGAALVLQPACYVPALRVVMRPVDNPALGVPLVLTIELYISA